MLDGRRACHAGSRAHVDQCAAEIGGIERGGIHQGQECDSRGEALFWILGIILWLPERYLASRACSAALCLLKVESGINGCLPTAWVPSIYSVSPLSRLRSALEKVSVFCAWKLFARCLAASCQTQKVLGSDLPGSNRAA